MVSAATGFSLTRMAERLAFAQQSGKPIDYDPATDTPPDLAACLQVQQAVARLTGNAIPGWKIAHNTDGSVSAPVYRRRLSTGGENWPHDAGALFGIEFELAVRLTPEAIAKAGAGDGHGLDWSRPERHILAVHAGIELLGSRYRQYPDIPRTTALADNLNQAGYVLGPELDPAILLAWNSTQCTMEIDGELVYTGAIEHPNGDPLASIAPCLARHDSLLPALDSTRFLTTGNLCGCFDAHGRRHIKAGLAGFGEVQFQLG